MRPMTGRVAQAKAQARRQCLQCRRQMGEDALAQASAAIVSRVMALEAWSGSRIVHAYVDSMAGEVQTHQLIGAAIDQGRSVVVPVVPAPRQRRLLHARISSLEDDLTQAGFDDFESIDLVIVPGLAFSANGERLGMGGGYYDRFLAEVSAPKVGIVCQALLLDSIPSSSHDMAMDWVVTERAVYDCRKEREG